MVPAGRIPGSGLVRRRHWYELPYADRCVAGARQAPRPPAGAHLFLDDLVSARFLGHQSADDGRGGAQDPAAQTPGARAVGEPGPGNQTEMKDFIIDRPSLQTARQRLIYGSVTLGFWVLWIYLWLPIVGLIGWALGIRI